MAQAVEEPGFASDENSKEGYVRLKIKIEGLKVKSPGIFSKVFGKHPHPEGKNAEIVRPEYHVRGFELNVRGGTGTNMRGAQYRLQIRRLPHDIEVDDCYITAEDGWIFMFLKKADVDQSWEKYIREGNLETAGKD